MDEIESAYLLASHTPYRDRRTCDCSQRPTSHLSLPFALRSTGPCGLLSRLLPAPAALFSRAARGKAREPLAVNERETSADLVHLTAGALLLSWPRSFMLSLRSAFMLHADREPIQIQRSFSSSIGPFAANVLDAAVAGRSTTFAVLHSS